MNNKLIKYLRSDHAGEIGAVYIYIGILKTSLLPKGHRICKKTSFDRKEAPKRD